MNPQEPLGPPSAPPPITQQPPANPAGQPGPYPNPTLVAQQHPPANPAVQPGTYSGPTAVPQQPSGDPGVQSGPYSGPTSFSQPQLPVNPALQSGTSSGPTAIPQQPPTDPAFQPNTYSGPSSTTQQPPALPPRIPTQSGSLEDDFSSPLHYTRDPHRLTAYIVPFPKPHLKGVDPSTIPTRFLIYTPPPPPIPPPAEGEKEGRVQKVQRKWQDEVREAKTSNAKVASWKGIKGRATKGIDRAMGQTKSSSLEFLNRIPGNSDSKAQGESTQATGQVDLHAEDGHDEGETTKRTVGLEEMVLVFPANMSTTQQRLREDFVESMSEPKSFICTFWSATVC